jgi:hypothetical protein
MLEVVEAVADDASISSFVIEISCGIDARPFLEVDRLERERELIASVFDLSIDIPCGDLVWIRDCDRDDLTKLPLQRRLEIESLESFVNYVATTTATKTDAYVRTFFEGNEAVDDALVFTFDEASGLVGVDLAFGDGVGFAFADDTADFLWDTTDVVAKPTDAAAAPATSVAPAEV